MEVLEEKLAFALITALHMHTIAVKKRVNNVWTNTSIDLHSYTYECWVPETQAHAKKFSFLLCSNLWPMKACDQ